MLIHFGDFLHQFHWALLLSFWQNCCLSSLSKCVGGQIALRRGRQVVPCTHRREGSGLCLVKISGITEQGIATKQLFSGSLLPKLSSMNCLYYLPLTCGTCCGPENGCFAIVLYSLSFWSTLGIIPSMFTWAHGTAWIYIFSILKP